MADPLQSQGYASETELGLLAILGLTG